jgi:hypothetical protein
MKKIILTVILLFVLLRSNGQISYFVEGGSSISRIMGRDSKNYSGFFGYYFGAGVEKIISKPVGISLSFFYKTRGFKSDYSTVTFNRIYTEKDNVEQSTLCIPLSAIYHFKQISIIFGYQLELLLKSKQEDQKITTNNGGLPYNSLTNYNDKYRFAKTESGLTLGLNVKIINNLDMSFKFLLASQAITPDYLWNYFGNFQIGIVKKIGGHERVEPIKEENKNQL